VSATVPADRYGLTTSGVNYLKNGISNGVQYDTVNIMAMDYYQGYKNMGQVAIDGANSLIQQLATMGSTAKVGVTAMIGQNDSPGEIFSLYDAQLLVDYAKTNAKISLLSFWSLDRDKRLIWLNQALKRKLLNLFTTSPKYFWASAVLCRLQRQLCLQLPPPGPWHSQNLAGLLFSAPHRSTS
jgi:hypothetical protein